MKTSKKNMMIIVNNDLKKNAIIAGKCEKTNVRTRCEIIYDSYISMENMLYSSVNYSNNYAMQNFNPE